ncbi:MAG: metallophosphoesterase [Phycisphaerales bacterium]|jgi:hypothetical protein
MNDAPTVSEAPVRHAWRPLRRLPEGSLDFVGDIHGEIDALRLLLHRLGYDDLGHHPRGRRLVFLGDLIDRGTDSLAVVRTVATMIDRGNAMALMGNHDLNAVAGSRKAENTWLFGHGPVHQWERRATNDAERREVLDFLRGLPLALERHDIRAVHACWDDVCLAALDGEPGPAEALQTHRAKIEASLPAGAGSVERSLALQNRNPVKLITSGPEKAAPAPYTAGGKVRDEMRLPWWNSYRDPRWMIFGHYWRIPVAGIREDDGVLSKPSLNRTLGPGPAMCIDYSVGGRWYDRSQGRLHGPFTGRLAALRWPEKTLVFDDGEEMPVIHQPAGV